MPTSAGSCVDASVWRRPHKAGKQERTPHGVCVPRHPVKRHAWSTASPNEKAVRRRLLREFRHGLSRVRGNSHARFLGEGRPAMVAPYPTYPTYGPKGMWSVPPLPLGLALPSRPPAERPHLTPSCCSCRNSVSPSSRPLGGRGAARRTVATAGRGWRRKRRPRCNGVDTGMQNARRRKPCPLPPGHASTRRFGDAPTRRESRKEHLMVSASRGIR